MASECEKKIVREDGYLCGRTLLVRLHVKLWLPLRFFLPLIILSFRNKYYGTRQLPHVSGVFRLTNTTQVGTHADSLIAEAVLKGITDFDLDLAWEAVHKDATVPPRNDDTTVCVFDPQETMRTSLTVCLGLFLVTLTEKRCVILGLIFMCAYEAF